MKRRKSRKAYKTSSKNNRVSRFANSRGVLFAADLEDESSALTAIRAVSKEIAGVKLGNILLYRSGPSIISKVKSEFGLPVIVDAKITDVGHIAERVASLFALAGADAITVSGVCGPVVVRAVHQAVMPSCEVWLFTEFTDDEGLLDEETAEMAAQLGLAAGATGFQAPGNRPDRVEDMRTLIGPECCIMSCGMGAQGGEIGKAISAGANFEIIGRWIYKSPRPADTARRFRKEIEDACR